MPCGGAPYGDNNLVFIANDWHTALLPIYLQARWGILGFCRGFLGFLIIRASWVCGFSYQNTCCMCRQPSLYAGGLEELVAVAQEKCCEG